MTTYTMSRWTLRPERAIPPHAVPRTALLRDAQVAREHVDRSRDEVEDGRDHYCEHCGKMVHARFRRQQATIGACADPQLMPPVRG
jgi:hypothetical protein